MLSAVEVRNRQGQVVYLPIEDVQAGFILEEIEGLDPVKATMVSSSFPNQDGAQFHSARREPRNLKFKIGLEPDYNMLSVEFLRKMLYGVMMPKSKVDVLLYDTDDKAYSIEATVEDFKAPLFTAEPKADISLMCFKPDFLGQDSVVIDRVTSPDFQEIELDVNKIDYEGNVETGFIFKITLDRDESAFTIYNLPGDDLLRPLSFAAPLLAGDEVTISTISGQKSAVLKRNNVVSSILYGVSAQSDWVKLYPGENKFLVYASGLPLAYSVEYVARYGGL